MSDLFAPKGAVAEWRMVYEKVAALSEGDVITYTDLSDLLGRDFLADRNPVYRATEELEVADYRTLSCVRGVGYRIAAANEHERLARGHHKRSRKQLSKAVSKAASADRAKLTPDERKRIDGLEMNLRQHADMIRRLDARTSQQADELRALRREKNTDVAQLSERVDRLAELLSRHGIQTKAS
jgi:hypothetical protein